MVLGTEEATAHANIFPRHKARLINSEIKAPKVRDYRKLWRRFDSGTQYR